MVQFGNMGCMVGKVGEVRIFMQFGVIDFVLEVVLLYVVIGYYCDVVVFGCMWMVLGIEKLGVFSLLRFFSEYFVVEMFYEYE